MGIAVESMVDKVRDDWIILWAVLMKQEIHPADQLFADVTSKVENLLVHTKPEKPEYWIVIWYVMMKLPRPCTHLVESFIKQVDHYKRALLEEKPEQYKRILATMMMFISYLNGAYKLDEWEDIEAWTAEYNRRVKGVESEYNPV